MKGRHLTSIEIWCLIDLFWYTIVSKALKTDQTYLSIRELISFERPCLDTVVCQVFQGPSISADTQVFKTVFHCLVQNFCCLLTFKHWWVLIYFLPILFWSPPTCCETMLSGMYWRSNNCSLLPAFGILVSKYLVWIPLEANQQKPVNFGWLSRVHTWFLTARSWKTLVCWALLINLH